MDDLQIPEIKYNFSGTTAKPLLIAVVPGRSGQGKSTILDSIWIDDELIIELGPPCIFLLGGHTASS